MPTNTWFRAQTERLSFFTVHWSRGKRLTLPYAAVTYMGTDPGERFIIMVLGVKVEGHLVGSRKRARRELEAATEALTGGKVYNPSPATTGRRGEAASPTDSAQDDPLTHSLMEFQEAFQDQRIRGVHHAPEARMRVNVYQRAEDGWEDFAF